MTQHGQPPDPSKNQEQDVREQRKIERELASQAKRNAAAKHEKSARVAAEESQALEARFEELSKILVDSLDADHSVDFEAMKAFKMPKPLEATSLAEPEAPPPSPDLPRPPGVLWRLIPGADERHRCLIAEIDEAYGYQLESWRRQEESRQTRYASYLKMHDEEMSVARAQRDQRYTDIDDLVTRWEQGEADAIAEYSKLAVGVVPTPDGIEMAPAFRFDESTNTLIGQIDLPDLDVIPEYKALRYIKSRSTTEPANKVKEPERNSLYRLIISSLALRAAFSVYSTDTHANIPMLVINGIVDGVDKATGKNIREVLISLSMAKLQFAELDLSRVEPDKTLKWLKAKVSPKPHSFVPVQPVLEFQMIDRRFIDAADVISGLSSKMNLMELTYNEFEDLITNLFNHMGYNSIGTSRSDDGGVDCVVYHHDPVFGGKVIVQAKRYKDKIGPAAVRELIGTLDISKAGKAILVTTSEFTDRAQELTVEYENVELINGPNLLHLLEQYAGVDARIEM